MTFARVLYTEFLKLRRGKVVWVSALAYTFMVAVAGFFMWMMNNPGMAARLGLIGQKASLAVGGETVDWKTYLGFILEMSGLGGLVLLSVIETFVFGREYAEGTAKNMLALPIRRAWFVAAKTCVSAIWFAVLTAWAIALTFLVGMFVGLPGFSTSLFAATAARIAVSALMALCLASIVAWIAVESRGYMAPLGFTIFALVLAMAFGATEWGRWCPWSILLWYTGASGPGKIVGPGSYAVLAATFALGLALTLRHETVSDNAQ